MSGILGEIAGLLTSVCWSFNSVVFTLAGRRVGAAAVNALRLWIAVPALMLIHWLLYSSLFPFAVEPGRLLYLGLSGLVGFVIGDAMLFESFLLIGPRLAMLLALLVPVFGAALAWAFLGESLPPLELAAIAVTLAGIAWVVSEGRNGAAAAEARSERRFALGIWLAVGGAAGQALGLLLSRQGLAGGYSAVSATLLRVSAASLILALAALLRGTLRATLGKMRDRRALLEISAGALTGPALGVVLSLVAIARASIGVASTLMSLTPVLLLPVSHFLFKERITPRAVAGTVVALLGVMLLFLV